MVGAALLFSAQRKIAEHVAEQLADDAAEALGVGRVPVSSL